MDLLFGFFTFFLVVYLIFLAHTFFIQSKRQEGMENAAAAEEDETKLKMKKINENSANKGNARKTDDEKPAIGVNHKNTNPLPNFIEPQPQLQSQHQPQQYHLQIPAQNQNLQNQNLPNSQNKNPPNSQNPNSQNQNSQQQQQPHQPQQNSNPQSNMDDTSVVVENMEDIQEPFGEDDANGVSDMLTEKNLRKVYVRNTTGYTKAGLGNIKGPIKLIKLMKIPKNKFFKPVIGFIIFINGILKLFNMIITFINKAVVYSQCAFILLVNFFTVPCFLWYVLNLIGTILYLIPLIMFTLCGVNDEVENYIWGPIYLLDEFIYDITGFHFAHFPDSINKGCFSCPSKFTVLGIPYIGDFFNVSFNFDFDYNIIPNYYA